MAAAKKKPAPKKAVAKKAPAKKAAPKPPAKRAAKKAQPKNTMSPPRAPGKPKATTDATRPGPLGARNGSGSIPYTSPGSPGGMNF